MDVVGGDGKIYGIPWGADSVLIIDPATETADTTSISGVASGDGKWFGGVLGGDGKIYGIPRNVDSVLTISVVGCRAGLVLCAPSEAPCPVGSSGTSVVVGDCVLDAGYHSANFTPSTNATTSYVAVLPVEASCPVGSSGTS
eukprot:SAG31_NODE_22470_length_524_cov_4.200000_1_plen_141_part_01